MDLIQSTLVHTGTEIIYSCSLSLNKTLAEEKLCTIKPSRKRKIISFITHVTREFPIISLS